MALLECYRKTTLDDYKKLSAGAQENLCASNKNKVKEILESDQMTMTNLVVDRVEILRKLGDNVQIQKRV